MQSLVSDKSLMYLKNVANAPATALQEDVLYSDVDVLQRDRLLGPTVLDVAESNVAANRLSAQIESRGAADIIKLNDTPTLYYKHGDTINTRDIMTEGLICKDGKLVSLGNCATHKTLRLPTLINEQSYQIPPATNMFQNNNTLQTLQIGNISGLPASVLLSQDTTKILAANTIASCTSLKQLALSNCICRAQSIRNVPLLQYLAVYPGTELCKIFLIGSAQQLRSIRLYANKSPLNVSMVHPGAFRYIRNLLYVSVDTWHAWHSDDNDIVLYDTIDLSFTGKKKDKVIWVSKIVTNYTAPSSVLEIADYCFSNSSALKTVDFSACSSWLKISKYAFTDNSATFTIKVPFTSTSSHASNAPWGAVNATIIYKDSE
jgi:hypothetical protein